MKDFKSMVIGFLMATCMFLFMGNTPFPNNLGFDYKGSWEEYQLDNYRTTTSNIVSLASQEFETRLYILNKLAEMDDKLIVDRWGNLETNCNNLEKLESLIELILLEINN